MPDAVKQTIKPKTFRVATEGATCDGRLMERSWIVEMAETYDPKTYGARVNMEHFRGILPDGPFRAYGDVTALSAREVEDGKMALFATIDPTPDLVALSKARQKIYTSIEVNTNFAKTGKAYLVGLAVTNRPASLGCEMLKFAAQAEVNPFSGSKQDPGNFISEAAFVDLSFDDDGPGLLDRVKAMFTKKDKADTQALDEVHRAIELTASEVGRAKADVDQRFVDLENRFDRLTEQLSTTPAKTESPTRPAATGAPAFVRSEF